MNRIKWLTISFVLLVLPISLQTCSKIKKEKIKVATSPNNPPLEMIDRQKRIVGFDIDVIKRIAELSDFSITVVPVLKGNLLLGLIDESYDIAISSINLEENSLIYETIGADFSKPYLEFGDVIVVSEDFENYTGLDSLKDKIVGIREGSKTKNLLTESGIKNIKEYSNVEEAFEELASNKIHALSIDLPIASRMVNYNDEYREIFKIQPVPITDGKYVIAVKKGNYLLLDKINSGIDRMREDSTLSNLIFTWFFSQ